MSHSIKLVPPPSPLNDNVGECFSALTTASIDKIHKGETSQTVNDLEKHVGIWASKTESDLNDGKNKSSTKKEAKKPKPYHFLKARIKVAMFPRPRQSLLS